MKTRKYSGGFFIIAVILLGCIEPYDPPLNEKDLDYLVVDAFLNGSDGSVVAKLSRSLPVKSTDPIPTENDAVVFIEDDNGGTFALSQSAPGQYVGTVTDLRPEGRYRLVARIGDEHEYVSDYTRIVQTPPIDSISWSVQRDGIQFEANAHDPSGQTRFVKWRFTETFEYRSRLHSQYMFASPGVVIPRPADMAVSFCWKTNESTQIIVGSVKHLQQSVINRFPVNLITYGSSKLFLKYSMLLRQQALTEETYNYWLSLEKSTEHLGGLFDPLPSEVSGNISCIHHEGEKALGLFSAATVQEKRIFLSRLDLPEEQARLFLDRSFCQADSIPISDLHNYPVSTLLVDAIYSDASPFPIGYTTAPPSCVDCRSQGGVTTQPGFWE